MDDIGRALGCLLYGLLIAAAGFALASVTLAVLINAESPVTIPVVARRAA